MFRPITAILRHHHIGRNMYLFTIFMTDIYLTISLLTHNGDDTSQRFNCRSNLSEVC